MSPPRVLFKSRPITAEQVALLNTLFARAAKGLPFDDALLVECLKNEIVLASTTQP